MRFDKWVCGFAGVWVMVALGKGSIHALSGWGAPKHAFSLARARMSVFYEASDYD